MAKRPGIHRGAIFLILLGACGSSSLNAPDAGQPLEDAGQPADAGTQEDAGLDAGGMVDGGYAAEHSAWPSITDGTGQVQNPMTLVTLVAANDTLATELFQFGDALVASQWWQTIGADYHLGTAQSVHFTGPAITSDLNASEMAAYVAAAISAGAPAPNGQTTYLLYLPDSIAFSDVTGCRYYSPYPISQTSVGDKLAMVRRCAPPAGESQRDALTIDSSALVANCATDPLGNSFDFGYTPAIPWDSPVWDSAATSGVIGVAYYCGGTRIVENGFMYQRIWSPSAAATGGDPCVPVLPIPYYNASTPQGWYSGAPGDQVSIPLTGWSTATTPDWFLNPHLINNSPGLNPLADGGFYITSSIGYEKAGSCTAWPASNNGQNATLDVQVPASAHSGDYGVFSVHSFRNDPSNSCGPPLSDDVDHQWLVGVYVP